ncbi:EthD domain-containing protein [Streptomyces endophyticus]|uniref:EthD domain-containing protein n=1 Tax=Streptomyces endophyticus TaxID=714166 RepID=A0ABU6F4A0_9ACTN|nr:EthD domain-containing protein [Streptomyces endophyticus]MEB8338235.1 EthD domain-containing protein [Streptomyces endophyticus]
MTVIRKRPEVSTEDFRRFMEDEYGPTYVALPQVREYVQYYLSDSGGDGAEDPIDAIVRISFDSEATMREALATDAYRKAHELRKAWMRDTSVGIHSAVLERRVQMV